MQRLLAGVGAATAVAALASGITAGSGLSAPERSRGDCEAVWRDGRWSAELVDVDHADFLDACATR